MKDGLTQGKQSSKGRWIILIPFPTITTTKSTINPARAMHAPRLPHVTFLSCLLATYHWPFFFFSIFLTNMTRNKTVCDICLWNLKCVSSSSSFFMWMLSQYLKIYLFFLWLRRRIGVLNEFMSRIQNWVFQTNLDQSLL